MKENEAESLAGFLKAAFPSMTDEQVKVYESSLVYEDAALASKAVLDGLREWKHPPRYAEIVERIRALRRLAEADNPRDPYLYRRNVEPIPFWVKRWVYARFVAEPRDMRPFKEQHEGALTPEGGWMPDDAYIEEAKMITREQVSKAIKLEIG